MACDPAAIQAQIDSKDAERTRMIAEAPPGEIGHDFRREINRLGEEIEQLERKFDICITVPDEAEPPVEVPFEVLNGFVFFKYRETTIGVIIGRELGFWFSASRQNVRIHEWPRTGDTLFTSRGSESIRFYVTGAMQRQQSGVHNLQTGHMRIPVVLSIHAGDYPFPAAADITLHTEPPGVVAFWRSVPDLWTEGHPLRIEDGRPTVFFVGEGTIRSGAVVGGQVAIALRGALPAGF